MNSVAFLYLRIVLALFFLVAGFSKLWHLRAFQDAVTAFRVVSSRLASAVAAVVVSLELTGAGLLLAGTYEWLGALFIGLLLVAFNMALIVNLLRGRRNLDCRCFGQPTTRIGWGHVFQNMLLLGLALLIGASALRGQRPPGWGDPITALLTILAAVYSVISFLAAHEMLSVRAGLLRVLSRAVQTD